VRNGISSWTKLTGMTGPKPATQADRLRMLLQTLISLSQTLQKKKKKKKRNSHNEPVLDHTGDAAHKELGGAKDEMSMKHCLSCIDTNGCTVNFSQNEQPCPTSLPLSWNQAWNTELARAPICTEFPWSILP
jgi:hypothetical protein